jgi:hypothetical protein
LLDVNVGRLPRHSKFNIKPTCKCGHVDDNEGRATISLNEGLHYENEFYEFPSKCIHH